MMKFLGPKFSMLALIALISVGCSKSGDNGSGGGGTAAPAANPVPRNLTYPASSYILEHQIEMTARYPTYYGSQATSFSISPALPTGLNFSTISGRIAGTPEALSAARTYTITASNAKGSTSTQLIIQVVAQVPFGLRYTSESIYAVKGLTSVSLIPQSNPGIRGGAVITNFSLNPSTLPAGLVFNSTLGSIEGTPTALAPAATYTLTGSNSGGSTSTTVTIEVLPELASLAAGGKHTCIIVDKQAKCWGDNTYGQLGDGTNITFATPQLVSTAASIRGLYLGSESSCLVASDFTSSCWGRNHQAQLGPNISGNVNVPTLTGSGPVSFLSLSKQSFGLPTSLAQSCLIDTDDTNRLRCYGEFSFGNFNSQSYEVRTSGNQPINNLAAVDTGDAFLCYVLGNAVNCVGKNDVGQLGAGPIGTQSVTPVSIASLSSGVSRVATGKDFACAIKLDSLYCWGNNSLNQLAAPSFVAASSNQPVLSENLPMGLTFLKAGEAHACVVADGKVYCWGDNSQGQLGLGSTGGSSAIPQLVIKTDNTALVNVSSLAVGAHHTCAISDNQVYCWGQNDRHQINSGALVINKAVHIENLY